MGDGDQNMPWKRRTLLLLAVAMLALGASCWLAFPHVTPLAKQWLARRRLPEMRQHLKDHNWQQAATIIREARRWTLDDPEVLHASLEFNTLVGGDPRSTLSILLRLEESGAATSDDIVMMGKMYVRLGEIAKARDIYNQIPAAILQQQHAQELHADLLNAAGLAAEASEARRGALQGRADDPAALHQLALMDLSSIYPARRQAMSDRLWQVARSGSPAALTAIDLLAKLNQITVPEVDELLQLVTAAPSSAPRHQAVKFSVLSTQLLLRPHLRTELMNQEIMRWKNSSPAQTAPLMAWLAAEREYALILRMIPAQTAGKYTDLLPIYVDALRNTGQWQQLHTLLTSGRIDSAYSRQKIRLWQVETQIHLHPDPDHARQTLVQIFEETGRGDDLSTTVEAGTLAEQLNQWDLAEKCFAAAASKHAEARPAMLTKVYQMASHQHDGPGMLRASSELLVLRPENTPLLTHKLYLQFLLGIGLELAGRELQSPLLTAADATDRLHLLHALAAHRSGQPTAVHTALQQVVKPEALSAGERAVYAALLKLTGGDPGKVFLLTERISPTLLLAEEQTFLQRAQ